MRSKVIQKKRAASLSMALRDLSLFVDKLKRDRLLRAGSQDDIKGTAAWSNCKFLSFASRRAR